MTGPLKQGSVGIRGDPEPLFLFPAARVLQY